MSESAQLPAPTRIVGLEAQNVMRIRAVRINPAADDHVVVLAGENEQGKSSVLSSIAMALGGKDEFPVQPLRKGQRKGYTLLDLGDLVVERTFTADGSTLTVRGADGVKFKSPQDLLNKLNTKIALDPLAFTREKPLDQMATLQALVGIDFKPLDAKKKSLFDDRTIANREVDRLRSLATSLPHYPDAPNKEESVASVTEEIQRANETNSSYDRLLQAARDRGIEVTTNTTRLASTDEEIEDTAHRISELQRALASMQTERANRVSQLDKAKAAKDEADRVAASAPRVDVAPLVEKTRTLEATNTKVRANSQREKAIADYRAKDFEARGLTSKIEEIESRRLDMLAAAKFPVEGLSFDENGILFQGIPFSQASAAQQLRVSVAIASKLQTGLRVILVRDGSLMDKKSRQLLEDLAKEFNLQVWLEVANSDDKDATVVIEDGMVRGAELPPEPAPDDVEAQSIIQDPATGAVVGTIDAPKAKSKPATVAAVQPDLPME